MAEPGTIDSPIALAVMSKAKRVFESDSTFLCFPLSPIAYAKEDLAFAAGGLLDAEGVLRLAEFSRLVNLLPRGEVWLPADETYLWSVYDDVLRTAVLAEATRSAEEEAEYEAALALLHERQPDGTICDTPALLAYRQHRDAWFLAQQEYNNAKVAADLATEPAAKERWRQIDEPDLRAKIADLEQAWIERGFRVEVERAQRTVRALGAKSPTIAWARWGDAFDLEVDLKTDTNDQRFVASGFAPANAVDGSGWQEFTLGDDEAKALIAAAPEELRRRMAPDAVALDIESLSFSYTSVAVTRPWFAPEVFQARFWKFRDDGRLLSDGSDPPAGSCPAYVSALVLIRDIHIALKVASPANDAAIARMRAQRPVSLGYARVAAQSAAAGSADVLRSAYAPASARALRAIAAAPPQQRMMSPAAAVAVRGVAPPPPRAAALSARLAPQPLRLRGAAFERIVRPAPGVPPPRPVAPPPPVASPPPSRVVESVAADEIYVMAFICKRLPRCPDPDPALRWV